MKYSQLNRNNNAISNKEKHTMSNTFVSPAAFLKGKSVKLTVGHVVDYTALGNGPHPLHGPIPLVTVTKVKDDGSLLEGTIVCPGLEGKSCGAVVTVHAGDVFQKRRCSDDQKVFSRKRAKVVDPATAKTKDEEKAKKLVEKEQLLATKKAEKEAAKAVEAKKKTDERAAKLAEKVQVASHGKTAADLVKAATAA